MIFFKNIFRGRDTPVDRTSGSSYSFFLGASASGKYVTEQSAMQMTADPTKKLRVAMIFSYDANEEEADGILDEENSEDISALDQPSREFPEEAIKDYNEMFHQLWKAFHN